jgi:hypothetical protein
MAVASRIAVSLILIGFLPATTLVAAPAPPAALVAASAPEARQTDSVLPAPQPERIADAQLCLDDMEVEPGNDDYDTVPVANVVDGGCQVPQDVVLV